MIPELISLAEQFRINVLTTGKFVASDDLSNEEYLLEIFRVEQLAASVLRKNEGNSALKRSALARV